MRCNVDLCSLVYDHQEVNDAGFRYGIDPGLEAQVTTFPCCIRIQQKPIQDASQYTTKPCYPPIKSTQKIEVSLSFKIQKLLSHASNHSNFLQVKVVKVEAMDANPSLLQYSAKPKKLLMSVVVNGLGQFLTAQVFFRSTSIPSLEII